MRGYPASDAATMPVAIAAPPNSVLERTASAAAIPAHRIRLGFFFLKKTINKIVAARTKVLPSSPPNAYAIM